MKPLVRFRLSYPTLQWRAPTIGMAVGLAYGIAEHTLDWEALQAPKAFLWLDEVVFFCLPVILGALAGLLFNHVRWQARINRMLSTDHATSQRHVLTHMLSSHLLHEIRNPLHNLGAVIEHWQKHLPPDEASILHRNVNRLQLLTNQLSRWTSLDDAVDLQEPVAFHQWLEEFIADKVWSQLSHANIAFEPRIDSIVVRMHPLLLEQCFMTLFNNAIEAVLRGDGVRAISCAATRSLDRPGYVTIRIQNTGAVYPATVLATQGREPIESQHGVGLGLVLVRRSLEHIGGMLGLANDQGRATATLWIPGAKG